MASGTRERVAVRAHPSECKEWRVALASEWLFAHTPANAKNGEWLFQRRQASTQQYGLEQAKFTLQKKQKKNTPQNAGIG